jgi:hypothetical protein
MVFGLSSGAHCCTPAIICHPAESITGSEPEKAALIWKPGNQEGEEAERTSFPKEFLDSWLPDFLRFF